jgi:hypothetical protein
MKTDILGGTLLGTFRHEIVTRSISCVDASGFTFPLGPADPKQADRLMHSDLYTCVCAFVCVMCVCRSNLTDNLRSLLFDAAFPLGWGEVLLIEMLTM